ncbi:uncharacterized protein EAE97_007638 [Botrytis byssoidea]|uniref:Inositol oxygenase n=1 Tax=Botrytis byssoidea TaxID=139641 RepID=A0A9P5IJJ8_9HELO|nr:uncharacterized protein EAE97_007638 [Botrytis byssoidea]KAF7937842.1 hypothetical protein EAE97_007638 [Botrytis byssoidea]
MASVVSVREQQVKSSIAPAEEQHTTPFQNEVDMQALEEVSDKIDELNVIKADMKKSGAEKDKKQFRRYGEAKDHVKIFYTEQHLKQTVEYNITARQVFANREPGKMPVMTAAKLLDKYVDQSDPDTQVGQLEHLFQTSEAARLAGRPDWYVVTGFVHDLGKLWGLMGAQGQWDTVGDTFIVGAEYSKRIELYESLKDNPDFNDPRYNTKYGIYSPGCGLDNVMMSWGHDEFLYQVLKDQSTLPPEALAMIRYHSFYPWHRENEYSHFENDHDRAMKPWVQDFNQFDLYSKSDSPPDVEKLTPMYEKMLAKYFPAEVNFGALLTRPTSSSSSSSNSS